jgi:hypothetical protein
LGCGLLENGKCGFVGSIYGIQALLFLSRISAVVIARLPVDVGLRLLGQTAPSPEIESGKEAAFLSFLNDSRADMFVISVSGCRRSALCELETVARKAELLQNHRLAISASHIHMHVDVGVSVVHRLLKICLKGVFTNPAPVIRPDMDIDIVYIRARMNLLEKLHVLLTAMVPLAA